MASEKTIEIVVGFAILFLLAGFVAAVISITTVNWLVFPDQFKSGLWTECEFDGTCFSVTRTPKMDGVRAMVVLSAVVSWIVLITIAVYIVYVCKSKVARNWINIFSSAFSLFAALAILIGILIYHRHIWLDFAKLNTNLRHGYSFWLAVAADILFFLAGLLFAISAILFRRSSRRKYNHYRNDNVVVVSDYKWNPVFDDSDVYVSKSSKDTVDIVKDDQLILEQNLKGDNVYYSNQELTPGLYSYGDMRIIIPDSRDFHIPRVAICERPISEHVWIA